MEKDRAFVCIYYAGQLFPSLKSMLVLKYNIVGGNSNGKGERMLAELEKILVFVGKARERDIWSCLCVWASSS